MVNKIFRTNRFRNLAKKMFFSFGIMLVLLIIVALLVPENSSGGWLILVAFVFLCYWIALIYFYAKSLKKKGADIIANEDIVIEDKESANPILSKIRTLDSETTVKEKIDLTLALFKKDNIDSSDILLPDDLFYYQWNGSGDDLRLMASKIFAWLKIAPKDLSVDFYAQMEPPGLYIHEKDNRAILINSRHRESAFECAAILSHEIMHYYLMGRHSFALADTKENELMTDLATIYSGLGVLIINSFYHYSGWHETIIGLAFGTIRTHFEKKFFGYFEPFDYGKHFKKYIDKYQIDRKEIYRHIVPTARAFLGFGIVMERSKETLPQYMQVAKKSASLDLLKRMGMIIILVPIGGLFLAYRGGAFNNTKSTSDMTTEEQTQVTNLKTSIDQLETQYNSCNVELSKDKSDTDSIDNQMNSYDLAGNTYQYNQLVPRQNQSVATYNSKLAECQKLGQDHDFKVDQYNKIIKK